MPGKVEQANALATMIAAGQIFIRVEHETFRRQAAVFSASYLRARGLCDALDAGMNALLALGNATTRASSVDIRALLGGSGRRHWG